MKTKHINIRLTPGQIEKLHGYASKYNMSGTQFLKGLVLVLIGESGKKEKQDSERYTKLVAELLAKQSEELEFYSQVIADTSSKVANSIAQTTMVLSGKKKRNKKKQTSSG